MARRQMDVVEKLLNAAKEEFLKKGYARVSLREVAEKAGTSTNAIYVRFHDKAGLFSALVQDPMADFISLYTKLRGDFMEEVSPDDRITIYGVGFYRQLMDFVYDNLDYFRILMDMSHGTEIEKFAGFLADKESEYLYKYFIRIFSELPEEFDATNLKLYAKGTIDSFFETLKLNISREKALQAAENLQIISEEGIRGLHTEISRK
jgi:AcrR family transcriptional regulator